MLVTRGVVVFWDLGDFTMFIYFCHVFLVDKESLFCCLTAYSDEVSRIHAEYSEDARRK